MKTTIFYNQVKYLNIEVKINELGIDSFFLIPILCKLKVEMFKREHFKWVFSNL